MPCNSHAHLLCKNEPSDFRAGYVSVFEKVSSITEARYPIQHTDERKHKNCNNHLEEIVT